MAKYLNKLLDLKASGTDKLLIVGLGVENKQFLQWLIEVVKFPISNIILCDKNNFDLDFIDVNEFESVAGEEYLKSVSNDLVKMVVKAPGVWSLKPEFEEFRSRYGQDSVVSSLVFFIEAFRENIVGVTGTKGKTTTSSLITHFLKDDSDFEVHYCGNTSGISPYKFWTDLETINHKTWFVMELSSFQLQDLGNTKISPKYAVITNYFVDHLDQHFDKYEYWESKNQIFEHQKENDFLLTTYQLKEFINQSSHKTTNPLPAKHIFINPIIINGIRSLYNSSLIGDHNWSNISMAMIISQIIKTLKLNRNDIEFEEVLEELCVKEVAYFQDKLDNFQAVKGRLELIKSTEVNNIKVNFYNDTTASEPDAVIAGIKALTENSNHKLYLILTGNTKKANYQDLSEIIKDRIKSNKILGLGLFGEVGQQVGNLIFGNETSKNRLKEFFEQEFDLTQTLDDSNIQAPQELNILFSPAGSSFDEFKNYIERGQYYQEWVEKVSFRE